MKAASKNKSNKPDLSIIIVNYNTSKLLNNCINSIKDETRFFFEIIVIDNHSNDDSLAMLFQNHPDVITIKNTENVGFARANNQGFEVASGRYVLMLNSDTLVLDLAIDKMVKFMDQNPYIGACGPKNLNPDMSLQYNCHHFPSLITRFINHTQIRMVFPGTKIFDLANMSYWDYDQIRPVDWITGACLLIRKETLDDVGYLDPNYFLYSEETDWCLRARKKGWPVVFYADASIIHYYGASSQNKTGEKVFSKNISRFEFQSQYYYFKKNKGVLYSLLVRLMDLMCFSAIYMAFFIKYGPKESEKKQHRLSQYKEYIRRSLEFSTP